MSTEVEIDPSFQLQPDATRTVPRSRASVEKTPKKKSLIGVFKKKNSSQYESIDDLPPTAPSTPDGPFYEDVEIDLTVNVVSAATDPVFGFNSDDNDNLMQTEIPDIFPHQENRLSAGEDQNRIVQPAQFKVPTQFEQKLEAVVDDRADKQQQEQAGNEQAKKILEAAPRQVGLVSAHTNDLAKKNDGVCCSSLNGLYAGPAQQRSSDLADEYARHENFEVVLDPVCFTTPEKEGTDEEVLYIQRDLEGFERQIMKEESDEVHDQGMQQEENQASDIASGASALAIAVAGVSTLPLENEAVESPMDTVEVSVEEPPEVKITVENTQTASTEEAKPKKKKTPNRKLRNFAKIVKAKAISSKASVKAISSRASKGLKSVPMSSQNKKGKQPNKKEKQEIVASGPEKPITKPKAVWRAVEDPESGRDYYYHRTTRETTWIKPDEYAAYERATEKYERDRAAYEKYHQKPIEEIVIGQIESSVLSQGASTEEEKGAVDVAGDELKRDDNTDDEEKPFDEEPPQSVKPFDEAYDDKPNQLPPLAAQGRIASHFSTLTEKTQIINNISRSHGSGLESSGIEESSWLGSLNNLDEDEDEEYSHISFNSPLMRRARARANRPSSSHRTRELRAEDLGSSRLAAETFDRRGRTVKGRGLASNEERSCFSEQIPAGQFDQDDAVSAMSEMDLDIKKRRDNLNIARSRALDDAIERKDGTLFSAVLIGMKASRNSMQETYPGWNQAHVDRMIANDDWELLKSYVSEMRDQPFGTKLTPRTKIPPVAASPKRIDRTNGESASVSSDYSV